ncbi:hypothetical protein SprV_0301240700 [Sparganum proliferum]
MYSTNGITPSPRSKPSTVHQPKVLRLFSAPIAVPYSPRRHKFYSDEPNTSEESSTAPPPSLAPPSPVFLKWRPAPTPTARFLSPKPSGPCSSSTAGKRPDRTRSLLRSKAW